MPTPPLQLRADQVTGEIVERVFASAELSTYIADILVHRNIPGPAHLLDFAVKRDIVEAMARAGVLTYTPVVTAQEALHIELTPERDSKKQSWQFWRKGS
jgi:hypothetical protein